MCLCEQPASAAARPNLPPPRLLSPPSPRLLAAHTFPKEAYEILLYIARAYLSSVLSLLYPLQSGRLALR